MIQFKRICIIGVGLIGGSIALAIKKRGLAKEVTGVFRRQSTMRKALRRRAVDIGTLLIEEGVRSADLIILAAPVSSIPLLARDAIEYAKDGAILTDVGSTKKWIVREIERMVSRKPVYFVGSHPMAGSEQAGVEFARADLMQDAPCIIVRTPKTDKRSLRKIARFWKALGAKVKFMSPSRHDRCVSLISHLPHVIAFSLAGAVPPGEIAYAAEGFRDTTRVASSDPALWADIFMTNKDEVLRACRIFARYHNMIKSVLARGDYRNLVGLLKYSKAKRDKFVIYGKRQ